LYSGNNDCLLSLDKYEAFELAKVDMGINVIVSNRNEVIFMNAGSPVKSHKQPLNITTGFMNFQCLS